MDPKLHGVNIHLILKIQTVLERGALIRVVTHFLIVFLHQFFHSRMRNSEQIDFSRHLHHLNPENKHRKINETNVHNSFGVNR